MHVTRLRVDGIRGFYGERAVDLDLTRPDGSLSGWTVLAGRNGSGKSTILQALALALAGSRSTAFVPSLADWMSRDTSRAIIRANLRVSELDDYQPQLYEPEAQIRFARPDVLVGISSLEPESEGAGIGQFAGNARADGRPRGWFYAGYGPFRHLGTATSPRPSKSRYSRLAQQVASLFDETVPLADAVDWLVEQHLFQLEDRPGAELLLNIMKSLLSDGLLPDGFEVRKVDSDGLWVRNRDSEFPLREMSDGYRAVTALVVDIVRQMVTAYPDLNLNEHNALPYPGVVLIDEVDAHLHVSWQQKIGIWLKDHFPEVQFIVTTHSPYICQSADPGGLILLPSPGENRPPWIVDQDLYQRVVYGSGDDAILSEMFGVETPYSQQAEQMRQQLGDLEIKVFDGTATAAEKEEYRALSERLTSSLTARADEVSARLRRDG